MTIKGQQDQIHPDDWRQMVYGEYGGVVVDDKHALQLIAINRN